jgi:hypothetical protein
VFFLMPRQFFWKREGLRPIWYLQPTGRGGHSSSRGGKGRIPNGCHDGGGSSRGSSGEKQGRGAEGTCYQAIAILGQPGDSRERRLLWRTAPTATKIHRPSPNGATSHGRITSCRGVNRGGGRGGEGACFRDKTLAAHGLEELFFQLCCCVSFWFWREIGFGFTYLCT